jgi:hypothetical protein
MNKAKICGILEIISAVFGLFYALALIIVADLGGYFSVSESSYLSSELYPVLYFFLFFYMIASTLALAGGLLALRKQHWGMAFTSAIFSMLLLFPCGIAAPIFIIQAKSKFSDRPSPLAKSLA